MLRSKESIVSAKESSPVLMQKYPTTHSEMQIPTMVMIFFLIKAFIKKPPAAHKKTPAQHAKIFYSIIHCFASKSK